MRAFSLPRLCLAFAILPSIASAQTVDIGFDDVTPPADVDLVIVREQAYGAGGVTLTPFGISGSHDFVQSIYVRTRHGVAHTRRQVQGRLVFSPGITVLGVISDGGALGGSADDGVLTESDLVFGIGGNPDDYSAPLRGLENVGEAEHVCLRPSGSVDFNLLMRHDDVDDFRVIIDYGASFPAGESFSVELSVDNAIVGLVENELGVRIGDSGGAILGSGDMGEVAGMSDVPLTSAVAGVPNSGVPFDPLAGILLNRVGGPVSDAHLEMYDPANGMHRTHARRGVFARLSRGPYGFVYGIQSNLAGFGMIDLATGSVSNSLVTGLEGAAAVIGGYNGGDEIVIAGHVSGVNSDTKVHLVDVASSTATTTVTVPQGALVQPIGAVWNGTEAFILDTGGRIARVNFGTGLFTVLQIPQGGPGSYWDLESNAAGTKVYALRQAGGTAIASIDEFDIASSTFLTSAIVVPEIALPRAMTRDAAGNLWVVRRTFGLPVAGPMAEIDPSTWSLIELHECAAKWDPNGLLADVGLPYLSMSYCTQSNPGAGAMPAVPNTTGRPGAVVALGSAAVADNNFFLRASDLPTGSFGYFINGAGPGFLPVPMSAGGHICFDPALGIGRHSLQVMSTGSIGSFTVQIDLTQLPRPGVPGGTVAVLPGQTWYFQCWHRQNPGTYNFTDAISVMFL